MLRRTLVTGLALAAAVALLVGQADQFGPNMTNVALLGVALGAVAGLVVDGSPLARVGGLGLGLLLAQGGYAARAAMLPDNATGRAIAAGASILVLTGLVAATAGRLQMWTLLLGAGAFVGAYETVYTASPTTFLDDSFGVATAVLLGLAVGFAVTSLLSAVTEPAPNGVHRGVSAPAFLPGPRTAADASADAEARPATAGSTSEA